jgi:hypothetical protein
MTLPLLDGCLLLLARYFRSVAGAAETTARGSEGVELEGIEPSSVER